VLDPGVGHRGDVGLPAVAAALTDSEGRPIGAIGVSGPVESMSGKRLEEDVAGLVVSKAKAIEVRLS
jgi:DNA-binding IclR family transcriptional regulator